MKFSWERRDLVFLKAAKTSRNVMTERAVWYVRIEDDNGCVGVGECAPLAGLSVDDVGRIESQLDAIAANPVPFFEQPHEMLSDYPSIRFGLEVARLALDASGGDVIFASKFTEGEDFIPINGLIWMGDQQTMATQVDQKLADGWGCIKLKIGALDFESELALIRHIREHGGSGVEIRVDANGAFGAESVFERLERLAEFGVHSIEQPVAPGNYKLLKEVCDKSPVPVALDEELIAVDAYEHALELLELVRPAWFVLKPGLLGGFSVCDRIISLVEEHDIGWWVTSALESNVGLSAIAQWLYQRGYTGWQGLGTGQLFVNNVESRLRLEPGQLWMGR
jgi:L-alanine-DL-glutamate epimerase-like enolase superfamily enzyme